MAHKYLGPVFVSLVDLTVAAAAVGVSVLLPPFGIPAVLAPELLDIPLDGARVFSPTYQFIAGDYKIKIEEALATLNTGNKDYLSVVQFDDFNSYRTKNENALLIFSDVLQSIVNNRK